MSPVSFNDPASAVVEATLRRVRVELGRQVREARQGRRWGTSELAGRAGVSRSLVFALERGEAVSLEAAARFADALGLRLEVDLVDPRRRQPATGQSGVVHAAMGEMEAGRFRRLGFQVALDEPYQHYQFAGRADFVAWDVDARALLHLENRTRFPDFQQMAGSFNAKRAYLGRVLAERLDITGWHSETHAIVGLWSAELLHALRMQRESFGALAGGPSDRFGAWWAGQPPRGGRDACLVVLDPLASGRQRVWIGLEEALTARPRHRGYADVARLLTDAA